MKISTVDFIGSYNNNDKMPKDRLPEIAIIGRSNVGKSSLINSLLNMKIAKTSSTPGKTQLINFFLINKKFYIVDLPGYGYAKIGKEEKKSWPIFIEKYLNERETLKIILFLLDIRREPNQFDITMNDWIKNSKDIIPIYVLTKIDKVSKNEFGNNKRKIIETLGIFGNEIVGHSSLKKIGNKEILTLIDKYLFPTVF